MTELGFWNGTCYVKVVEPQPPFEDPRWGGRTEGVIVECKNYPRQNDLGFAMAYVWVSYWMATAPGVAVDPAELARRAIASLQLRTPPIGMTPPPNIAEPNILITLPAAFWFTEASPTTVGPATASATDQGLTVTLTATLSHVTFDTGDGQTITCTGQDVATAPPPTDDLHATPPCGHAWQHTSRDQPGDVYSVTATSHWDIAWTGGGQTGTLTTDTDATINVAVTDHPVRLVPNP